MGDVRRVLWLLTLAGCNQVYGLDPTTVRTLEPPFCSTVQFSVPQILPEFDDDDDIEFDPQLSANGKELWFAFATPISGGGYRNQMYRSVRVGDRFGEPVLVDLVSMTAHVGDPALTADGLRMIFRVDDTPALFYEAIRETPSAFPFKTVVPALGVPGDARSFDLTWDGLRMYVAQGDGIVTRLTRSARDKPFVEEPLELLTNAAFPTVSGDELEIFYVHTDNQGAGDSELYRSARTTTTEPFTGEQLVLENAGDADIAPTSSEMIIAYMGALAIMKRTCDED